MKKIRLLTPGPTAIPESVLSKFAEPIVHHRTTLFEAQFKTFQSDLQWLFQTPSLVLTLTATGTGAMDATVCNLFSPGEEVITINCGKFGERWSKIAQAYSVTAHEIKVEWGKSVEVAQVEAALKAHPKATAVLFQASETSTGAMMPVKGIVDACKRAGVLSVIDGITAVGIFELPMDAWGIDVLITGSQKALMLPPGLAFIALSDRAWKKAESSKCPKYYFDLSKEKKMQLKQQTAWTPAISLIAGGVESLKMLREQGLPALFKHHETLAACTRAAAKALGLELFAAHPGPVITSVKLPSKFSTEQGVQVQKIMQDKFGVIVTGGQDEMKGKILRLTHFGYTDVFDVMNGIGALELTLSELGYSVNIGAGVGAVLKTYQERSGTPS